MKEEKAKEFACSYNTIRRAVDSKEGFTVERLQGIFRNKKFPFGRNYVKAYVDAKMLIRVAPGKFSFPEAPVLYNVIGQAIDKVRNYQNKMHKQYLATEVKKLEEEECIKYLKSKGYKILKPETRWNEI
jgi:nitrate reductase beta subunit